MSQAIRIHENGGPEVLQYESVPIPEPGAGEVRIHHEAVGVNFIDVYFRTGLYKTPLPATIGMEAAGRIAAIGDGVSGLALGDRVAYATGPIGAYAADRVIAADRVVRLPDTVPAESAAALMLQGMTAYYLLHRTFPVHAGHTILVYAAAGGVGLIMCQWARSMGVRVIGVVSTEAKATLARDHGAAEVIVGHDDLPAKVKRLTDGAMVPVVYDSVGRDTFSASIDCLAPLGMMVSYGNSSGPAGPVEVGLLATKGSLFLTRPTLATYVAKRQDLVTAADALFSAVARGAVRATIGQRFPLQEAAAAHRLLEARQTTGSTVLIP